MSKGRYRFLIIILVMLPLMASGCFQVINQETSNTSSNPSPTVVSNSQRSIISIILGANSGERFGASVAPFRDVDGAGHQGIAVGATAASPSNKNSAGSVYVISFVNVQTRYRLDGQEAGDQFGRTLAMVGDLNGDKVSEFIVGAPTGDVGGFVDAGYVGLYSGKDGRSLNYYTGTANNFRLGHSLAGLGDINEDTIPDFAIGTPFANRGGNDNSGIVIVELSQNNPFDRKQLTIYGEAAGDKFGWAIAGIGDVNGDNVADIAVSAPGVKSSGEVTVGRVYVLSGNNGTILYKIDGTKPVEKFGYSITGIDDINGDKVGDLVVGAPAVDLFDNPPPVRPTSYDANDGKAYVFSGKDGRQIYKLEGFPQGSSFGFSLASGDIDGDGLSDIVVGDPSAGQKHGSIHLYSGRDGKSLNVFVNNPNRKDEVGFALSAGNDLNGDGRTEVIVGAYSAPNIEGKPTGMVLVLNIP